MKQGKVQIDELRVRVPGLSREYGERLGAEIKRQLASTLPQPLTSKRISELSLRIESSGPNSVERIASQVAARIRLSIE